MKQEEAFKKGTDEQFIESLKLGPWTSYSLLHDPKHMCFVLSRYKFCSKILTDKKNILEVGCGDGFGTPIVASGDKFLLGIDTDSRLIRGDTERLDSIKNIRFATHDMCQSSVHYGNSLFDGAFSIDVIEHLDSELELSFMKNICGSISEDGIYVMGTPNITANTYATYRSKVQHINLKSFESLHTLMCEYFKNVLMFSMNDEIVHTGYGSMAHYLFSVGIGVK
jgi:2-polyprenyl-3-methyl-5-hydroxy-6-metoxy-1,4-benzoquinol methylase